MSELASQEAVMNGTLLVFHVGISLIGIASGVVVMYGLLTGRPHGGWTVVFLATTVLTRACLHSQQQGRFTSLQSSDSRLKNGGQP
jgi:hypothetical protein